MVYINYVTTKSMSNYTTQDDLTIYKKVLNGDSFEITSFYLSPKSCKSVDRDSENEEYHQNAVFTIKTDAGETEEFNIDVGYFLYNYGSSSYYRRPGITKPKDEIYPYLRKFGIACKNKTVFFEPHKEKNEIVYSNTQLVDWLKEQTSYIDSMFEKVANIQKKKRELEADFKNLSDEVFDESEIENYRWYEYNK